MEQNSSTQINKVKYMEGTGKISVDFSRTVDGHTAQLSGIYDEQAEPEFYEALDALLNPALAILELKADDFSDRLHPYGVTYKYGKDGTISAIISSKLDVGETQVAINTPLRSCGGSEEADEKTHLFDAKTVQTLQNLQQYTMAYISGKRAQMSLFDGHDNEQPDADKDEDPFRDDPHGNIVDIGHRTVKDMQSPTQA